MSAFRPISPMRVGSPRDGTAHLAALRRRIAALERRPAVLEDAAGGNRARGRSRSLGIEARDGALPEDGLAADGLHESAGATAADAPAAAAFLAALLAHVENLTRWLDPPTPNEGAVQPSPDSTGAGPRGGRRRPAVNTARHPRNQRVIPNSRDFRIEGAAIKTPGAEACQC